MTQSFIPLLTHHHSRVQLSSFVLINSADTVCPRGGLHFYKYRTLSPESNPQNQCAIDYWYWMEIMTLNFKLNATRSNVLIVSLLGTLILTDLRIHSLPDWTYFLPLTCNQTSVLPGQLTSWLSHGAFLSSMFVYNAWTTGKFLIADWNGVIFCKSLGMKESSHLMWRSYFNYLWNSLSVAGTLFTGRKVLLYQWMFLNVTV